VQKQNGGVQKGDWGSTTISAVSDHSCSALMQSTILQEQCDELRLTIA
jgi:hypothetical protein